MRIRNGEPLEIYTDKNGEVILKKYAPINELEHFAQEYADSLNSVLGHTICVVDRDEIISVSGVPKKDLVKKDISEVLEETIKTKETKFIEEEHSLDATGRVLFKHSIVSPIITNGEAIGAIIITAKEDTPMGSLEKKLAETAASFLAKQMEERH